MSPNQNMSNPSDKLEEILRVLPYFVYVVEKDGTLKYANEKLLSVLGVASVEELPGSFYEYFDKKLKWIAMRANLLQQTDQEVLVSGKPHYQIPEPPVTDARGLTFFYEATRVPLKNEASAPEALIVCLVDVTPQRMLEIQLQSTALGDQEKLRKRPYPPNIHRDASKAPRILLIEDNPIAQQSTAILLKTLDCVVEMAETETALNEMFQLGKYDFILMDIGLEGTTGYMLAKRIRQIEGDSGYCVPIIALTGFDAEMVKIDCDYYFMEGAITKPLTIDQSRQMIQRYVYQVPVVVSGLKSLYPA